MNFFKRNKMDEINSEDTYSDLLSWAPKYEEKKHSVYVKYLKQAIDEGNKNIALSGLYGTGKSSILQEVIKEVGRDKIIQIALSPLCADGMNASSEQEKINYIEREIVKQLLYSASPKDVPLSHFKRLQKVNFLLRVFFMTLITIVVFMELVKIDYGKAFADIIKEIFSISASWANGIVGVFVFICLLIISILVVNKISVTQIQMSAGPVVLKLENGVETFFDQYLEEIIYILNSTGKTIIIFEDLDRFDNPEIFDSLRSLNQLLNNLSDVKEKKLFQFVYAIRDDIFGNQKDDKQAGKCFERTKFFDCIIPVVPFISHENASLIAREYFEVFLNNLDKDDAVDKAAVLKVLDVTSRYVTDVRTLKNIRNEFYIYKKQNPEMKKLGLDNAHLLAFLFYKNIYLEDEVKLQVGESTIDAIYEASREVVKNNVTRLLKESSQEDEKHSNEEIANLRGYTISNLISHTEYKISYNGKTDISFRDFCREKCKRMPMLFSLIEGGLIDKDYNLYAFIFNANGLTRGAANFLYHVIYRNKFDYNFELNSRDIEILFEKNSPEYYNPVDERWLLNIHILDYLLSKGKVEDSEITSKFLDNLSTTIEKNSSEVIDFVNEYLKSGNRYINLLKYLASKNSIVFSLLLSLDIKESLKLSFFIIVIHNMNESMKYRILDKNKMIDFINLNYASIFNERGTDFLPFTYFLSSNEIFLPDISVLPDEVLCAIDKSQCYIVNKVNLSLILKDKIYSLDVLKVQKEGVYKHIINSPTIVDNIVTYLEMFELYSFTPDSINTKIFLSVLGDINNECEKRSVEKSNKEFIISLLLEKTPSNWKLLEVNDQNYHFAKYFIYTNKLAFTIRNLVLLFENSGDSITEPIFQYILSSNFSFKRTGSVVIPDELIHAIIGFPNSKISDDNKSVLLQNLVYPIKDTPENCSAFLDMIIHSLNLSTLAASYRYIAYTKMPWKLKRIYFMSIPYSFNDFESIQLLPNDAFAILSDKSISLVDLRILVIKNQGVFFSGADGELLKKVIILLSKQKLEIDSLLLKKFYHSWLTSSQLHLLAKQGFPSEIILQFLVFSIQEHKISFENTLKTLYSLSNAKYRDLFSVQPNQPIEFANNLNNNIIFGFLSKNSKSYESVVSYTKTPNNLLVSRLPVGLWNSFSKE